MVKAAIQSRETAVTAISDQAIKQPELRRQQAGQHHDECHDNRGEQEKVAERRHSGALASMRSQ
jgi:hypothetical protein